MRIRKGALPGLRVASWSPLGCRQTCDSLQLSGEILCHSQIHSQRHFKFTVWQRGELNGILLVCI